MSSPPATAPLAPCVCQTVTVVGTGVAGVFALVSSAGNLSADGQLYRSDAGLYLFSQQSQWIIGYPEGRVPLGFTGLPARAVSLTTAARCPGDAREWRRWGGSSWSLPADVAV